MENLITYPYFPPFLLRRTKRRRAFIARLVMIKVPTTRERSDRYAPAWKRIWARLLQGRIHAQCKLGREPQQRRRDKCSACSINIDLQLDHAVAQLIREGVIAAPANCPYLLFTRALGFALLVGPGAEETRRESERTRIIELKTALQHVDRALKTLVPDRWEIRSLGGDEDEDEELFVRLADVVRAETLIDKVVKFFIENAKRTCGEETDLTKPARPRRGRPGALDVQGIVSCCDDAWKELIGKQPGKNNVNFHDLLRAAAETVLGPLDAEPDWEHQIVAARQRQRGWKSGQKSQD